MDYAASKGAIDTFNNAVRPGFIYTGMDANRLLKKASYRSLTVAAQKRTLLSREGKERGGQPQEVAGGRASSNRVTPLLSAMLNYIDAVE